MAIQVFKEQFSGKYDGTTPATMLPKGWIADGKNVRKVSATGGWKVRKGCALNNTTAAESGSAIKSLHCYEHPRNGDYHFIAQCNSKLLDATNDPPATGTTFGSDLATSEVGTTPGFSDVVGELLFYADGNAPLVYGGDNPFCSGFLTYDDSTSAYVDYTRWVTDENSDTEGEILGAADDYVLICSPEIADGIVLDLGTGVNSNAVTLVVSSWQSGSWSSRTGDADWSDGTASGGNTLAQDGTVTWTRQSSDTMQVFNGIMGYWYKVSWSGALSGAVDVVKCQVVFDMTSVTNKWDGIPNWPTGAKFYDASATEFQDVLGKVTNEATSQYADLDAATTSDFLYIKAAEPVAGFGFAIPVGYSNSANAQVDQIDYWNGSAWTAITTGITDETMDDGADSSFSQTGWIWWNAAAITPVMRKLEGDPLPGYWYRLSWDAALSADTRIYAITYAPFPVTLPDYDGCIQFKDRLFLWGDPEFPNRLRYSAHGRPDCFSGQDSGYTDSFGDMKPILACVRFYNELVVFKSDSVWLLEGYSPENFGKLQIADTVGLASPKTAFTVEVGYPSIHRDEALSIVIWQEVDGVYVLDGRKPKKISGPVEEYFNPEYANCIAAANIRNRQAFVDQTNDEWHLLLPSSELVYNCATDEWYPPWEREIDVDTGLCFKGTDDRYYTYGGSSGGLVMRLETDTTDKTTANVDKAIEHSIKTRAISAQQGVSPTFRYLFRGLWAEMKAQTAGSVTTRVFPDMATSGTTLSAPGAISMVNSGYNLAFDNLYDSRECVSVQVEFSLNVADQELEIYSFLYSLDVRGLEFA